MADFEKTSRIEEKIADMHCWDLLSVNILLTLSDVGRGGQKGNKWECCQKFLSWKVHFPRGLMDKALDFDTKGS